VVRNGVFVTQPSVADKSSLLSERATGAHHARLLLQDPNAYDQASQPSLRLSQAIELSSSTPTDRENARSIWEHLSTEPEAGGEYQAQRKQLLLSQEKLARESNLAQQQVLDLQTKLGQAQEDRFRHPAVFGGVFALLGMGALWFLERRKRMEVEKIYSAASHSPDSPGLMRAAADEAQSAFDEVDPEESSDLGRDFATDLSGIQGEMEKSPVLSITATRAQTRSDQIPSWVVGTGHQASTEKQLIEALSVRPMSGPFAWMRKVFGRDHIAEGYRFDPQASLVQASGFERSGDPSTMINTRPDDVVPRETVRGNHVDATERGESPITSEFIHPVRQYGDKVDTTDHDSSGQDVVMEHLLELRTLVAGLRALGREEEAAATLHTHIELEPMTCAWAYLEYMQLCEQLNRTDEFELARSAYRKEFNRMAPTWHEPNANVLGLDGYSRATAELCAAWVLGVNQTRQVLQAWLIGPMVGRKLIQLPAFHDLFDLYELLEFLRSSDNETESLPLSHGSSAALSGEMRPEDLEQEFVPTVSLLDLDFEFSSDVTIEKRQAEMAEKAVTVVKPGEFSLDFNVTGAQTRGLVSRPAELNDK
jgi:hypothetical protein